MTWQTPLPYMGGKQRAVRKLAQYIPDGLSVIGSPFFGGGSFEFYLAASRGVDIIAADAFAPLVNFWQWELRDPRALSDELARLVPVDKETYFEFHRELESDCPPTLENAAKIYILYVAGFNKTLRRGHSPRDLRENNRRNWAGQRRALRNLHVSANVTIKCQDVYDFLAEHPDLYCYFDPPYTGVNSDAGYYGFNESMHEAFDHEKFANTLRDREADFLLSYLDCQEIRDLYSWAHIHELTWNHSSKQNARKQYGKAREWGRELAIVPCHHNRNVLK